MKLLAIDTALNACSVAIVDGDAVLARIVSPGGKGNAERLLPLLDEVVAAAGTALADLDGFAATTGPGSFTGIRTGLATARALALATGRKVRGVTTTAVLAAAAVQPGRPVVAAIDARRGEIYLQGFDDRLQPLTDPLLLPLAAAVDILPAGAVVLTGSGAVLLRDAARREDLVISGASHDPDPVLVARLAAALPEPQRQPAPLYIRPPDAALPKQRQPQARLAVTIRPCEPTAVDVIAALHEDAFARQGEAGWSAESLGRLLAMPGALALLATAGDQPAGFLLMRVAADEAEIITLAVHPLRQRLGVAASLLREGLAACAKNGAVTCFLEVAEDNLPALALYRAAGFEEAGRRRGYYDAKQKNTGVTEKRRDAILMKRRIGP